MHTCNNCICSLPYSTFRKFFIKSEMRPMCLVHNKHRTISMHNLRYGRNITYNPLICRRCNNNSFNIAASLKCFLNIFRFDSSIYSCLRTFHFWKNILRIKLSQIQGVDYGTMYISCNKHFITTMSGTTYCSHNSCCTSVNKKTGFICPKDSCCLYGTFLNYPCSIVKIIKSGNLSDIHFKRVWH